MLLVIDNYDSFTYNLVQYFASLGAEPCVMRNDCISLAEISAMAPRHIVISPGPGRPGDAGISIPVVQRFAGQIPILGVCLGHQAIAEALGGRVVHAARIMHGKTSRIYHDGQGVFSGLSSPFRATRYHSLLVEKNSLPSSLEICAWTRNRAGKPDEIMAFRNPGLLLTGVQFHPEAVLTEWGHELLANFLRERA